MLDTTAPLTSKYTIYLDRKADGTNTWVTYRTIVANESTTILNDILEADRDLDWTGSGYTIRFRVVADSDIVSTGVYIIRRRLLIELLEKAEEEERYDFVKDILIRNKSVKKLYAYMLD